MASGKSKGSSKVAPTKKPALGRGLSALFPDRKKVEPPAPAREAAHAVEAGPTVPFEVEIARLSVNRFQPRTDFDEAALEELAQSIRATGILQPIVVSRSAGGFTIIAGERRFRAAQKAGLSKVPVTLRNVTGDQDHLELALVENLQRQDLNVMEEAEAFRKLRDDFHLTQEEIAARVGRDRSSIANVLRLLRLPVEIQNDLRSSLLSFGHAKAILGLEKEADRLRLGREIVDRSLSVRQAEEWVASRPDGEGGSDEPKKVAVETQKDVFTRDAEEKLAAHLRTRVEIVRRRKGGQLRLSFASEDELIRLYDILTRTSA